MEFVDLILSENAVEYMRTCLGQSRCRFAQYLLEYTKLEEGIITSLVPTTIQEEISNFSPEEFGNGGITDEDTSNYLVQAVQGTLNAGQSMCIVQNENADIGDPHIHSFKSRLYNSGNELYHVVFSDEPAFDKIDDAITESRSYLEIGAVSIHSDSAGIKDKPSFEEQDLIDLASRAILIFCSAYDGEGYLVWKIRL